MDAEGGNKRKLTDHNGFLPAWSADGSQIAYEAMGKKNGGIRVVNSDGSDDHLIDEEGRHPDWSN
jgi:Tol biopolymer transport system component